MRRGHWRSSKNRNAVSESQPSSGRTIIHECEIAVGDQDDDGGQRKRCRVTCACGHLSQTAKPPVEIFFGPSNTIIATTIRLGGHSKPLGMVLTHALRHSEAIGPWPVVHVMTLTNPLDADGSLTRSQLYPFLIAFRCRKGCAVA